MNKLSVYSRHTADQVTHATSTAEGDLLLKFDNDSSLTIPHYDLANYSQLFVNCTVVSVTLIFNDLVAICFENDLSYINVVVAEHACLTSIKRKKI